VAANGFQHDLAKFSNSPRKNKGLGRSARPKPLFFREPYQVVLKQELTHNVLGSAASLGYSGVHIS
jgi:hypothetical protein